MPHMNETAIAIIADGVELVKGDRRRSGWMSKCQRATVEVGDKRFSVGRASGGGMNWLIGTLRQVVAGGVGCDVHFVRHMLELAYDDVRPGDFLELTSHWEAIVRHLSEGDDNGITVRAAQLQIICVDLLYVGHCDVVGIGGEVLYIARGTRITESDVGAAPRSAAAPGEGGCG